MKVSCKFRRDACDDERGVTIVLVAIAMVAIIAMAAISIDLVTLYLAKEEAQRTADAAALAAARVIAASGVTSSGNPPGSWAAICGGSTGWATQAALAAGFQNTVNSQPSAVNVSYSDGSASNTDCSTLSAAFAVNPMVTVTVSPVSIPSFFSRIWGISANSVSATATAEAFNPSSSATTGVSHNTLVIPVQPQCVKPWIVPNLDPRDGSSAIVAANGSIVNPGVSTSGDGTAGIVGEQFTLHSICTTGNSTCSPLSADNPPKAIAISSANVPPFNGQLEYAPGAVAGSAVAVPSCARAGTIYEKAVAGCDQSTVYQCGLQGSSNTVDLNENPMGTSGDTARGVACALTNSTTVPLDGQDTLISGQYPFVALAGRLNPLGVPRNNPLVNSNSMMTLPIYQNGPAPLSTNNPITIVGFLQVFVNDLNANGDPEVTVLNVAGCGSNASTNPPLNTNSAVPVRLITPH